MKSKKGDKPEVLVIFDNVYFMDETSWRLLELVREENIKIAIILLV